MRAGHCQGASGAWWVTDGLIQSGRGSRGEGKHFLLCTTKGKWKIQDEISWRWLWPHPWQSRATVISLWVCVCVCVCARSPKCDCVMVNSLNRCENNLIKTNGSQCFAQEQIISSTPPVARQQWNLDFFFFFFMYKAFWSQKWWVTRSKRQQRELAAQDNTGMSRW